MKINTIKENINERKENNLVEGKELQRWKRRIIFFRFIYSVLVMDLNKEQIHEKLQYELPEFKDDELNKIIEFFAENKSKIETKVESLLKENWTLDRLNKVDLALIISAFCEYTVTGINRKIIIDQAIITSKKYSEKYSYKFINFILDKLLPKE